jgi:hypothetical protein
MVWLPEEAASASTERISLPRKAKATTLKELGPQIASTNTRWCAGHPAGNQPAVHERKERLSSLDITGATGRLDPVDLCTPEDDAHARRVTEN